MVDNYISKEYAAKKDLLKKRLENFRNISEKDMYYELVFCMLTPQSNAQRCWEAVESIKKLDKLSEKKVNDILKTKTRFHNNKTRYVIESESAWKEIKGKMNSMSTIEIRNWIAENVNGIGLKEAGHFLRNIGKSNNGIAILDRHILKHLHKNNIINEPTIKNKKNYFEIESAFLNYAKSLKIPADELDLVFWSMENGEIFK